MSSAASGADNAKLCREGGGTGAGAGCDANAGAVSAAAGAGAGAGLVLVQHVLPQFVTVHIAA